MAKRVFEIAKELGIKSKSIIDRCQAEGIPNVQNHMSSISAGLEATIVDWFSGEIDDIHRQAIARDVDLESPRVRAPAAVPATRGRMLRSDSTKEQPLEVGRDNDLGRVDRWSVEGFSRLGIWLPDELVQTLQLAYLTGRHLLLSGPPGTAKTEVAKALPTLLFGDEPRPYTVATANAAWSSYEVVGGLRPVKGEIEFAPGVFTAAVQESQRRDGRYWLILDEINRADIDRALGSVFTALQDFSLILEADAGRHLDIPRDFRVIATMNTADRNSLFPMSSALRRRFAVVDFSIPLAPDRERELVERRIRSMLEERGIAWDTIEGIAPLLDRIIESTNALRRAAYSTDGIVTPELQLGPAATIDLARLAVSASIRASTLSSERLSEIIDLGVRMLWLPQWEGLLVDELERLHTTLESIPFAVTRSREVILGWIRSSSSRL